MLKKLSRFSLITFSFGLGLITSIVIRDHLTLSYFNKTRMALSDYYEGRIPPPELKNAIIKPKPMDPS